MRKLIILLLILVIGASSQAGPFPKLIGEKSWLALDIYHQSRALPLGDRFIRFPFNPGLQATYRRVWLGKGELTGGSTTIQGGYSQFDLLFWTMHLGGGLGATWKSQSGIFSNYAIRLDYERLFTGSNNFELEKTSYKQSTDTGRGYLCVIPIDFSIGYSPRVARELGIIPALRFAWAVDLPLYKGKETLAWSYTK